MKCRAANPLANKSGEGAPIAPEGWRWKAGTRRRDMSFISPGGKVFRSRCSLKIYLRSMKNAPSEDKFCWSITEEVLNHPALSPPPEVPPASPDSSSKWKTQRRRRSSGTNINSSTSTPSPTGSSTADCMEEKVPARSSRKSRALTPPPSSPAKAPISRRKSRAKRSQL